MNHLPLLEIKLTTASKVHSLFKSANYHRPLGCGRHVPSQVTSFCRVTFRLNASLKHHQRIAHPRSKNEGYARTSSVKIQRRSLQWFPKELISAKFSSLRNSNMTQTSTFSAHLHGCSVDLRTGTLSMNSDLEIRYTRGYTVLPSDGKVTCAKWNVKSRFTLSAKYPTSWLRFESPVVSAKGWKLFLIPSCIVGLEMEDSHDDKWPIEYLEQ